MFAAFGAGFVQFFGGEFGAFDAFFFGNLFLERLPEFVHHRYPLAFAVGDFVELVFEFGGEVVIDVLGEVVGQEFVDDVAGVGGHEAFLLKGNVFAVFERGDNAGVGRWAADAIFFECFNQRGFVVTRRRSGEVLLAIEFVHRQFVAFAHFGQFFAVFAFFIVAAFFVNAEEACEGLHLSGYAECAFADGNIDGGLVEFGWRHLTRDGALPNHLIEFELVCAQEGFDAFGRTVHGSRTDGFVRFLGVFGFGFVLFGSTRQIFFADFVFDVMADFS